MSATALRSTALDESGALTLRGRDALLLPVFGKETELAFERTMRKEVDLGSGFCEKMYHRENNKWIQPHPSPLKSKLTSVKLLKNPSRDGTFFRKL